ncbi:MAG: tetratricopeptide repeat protein [Treponema sp.]|nr:tetratricopeptide repeat protein [Treponema sp.]
MSDRPKPAFRPAYIVQHGGKRRAPAVILSTGGTRRSACYEKGDYARARADWEQALQLDPSDPDARQNLEILRQQGR